ncbi:MAG: FtsW/RodA/SpoVE family cell cycle protein [Planctomycetota bacterium]
MTSLRRHLDWVSVSTVTLLVVLGVVFIWSSTYGSTRFADLWIKQVRYAMCAIPLMILVLKVPYPRWVSMAPLLYALLVCTLLAVLVIGVDKKGARRWIGLGDGFELQPAEFAKLVLILMLARLLSAAARDRQWATARAFGFAAPLMMLIAAEPDLGSSLILLPVLFAMLYVAGANRKMIAAIALAAPLLGVAIWFSPLLKDYQRARLRTFVVPWSSLIDDVEAARKAGRPDAARAAEQELNELRRGEGFQQYQAMISVGSGGLGGKGLLKGPQNRLEYLPESHTDFIFAVIAEEWGFTGAAGVITALLVLALRLLFQAHETHDPTGRLIQVGVAAQLSSQAFVNIGMTLGILPITGVTLPFLSLGGSSLWVSLLAVAFALNVGLYRHRIFPFY